MRAQFKMKFSFLVCLLILCPIGAQSQSKATTEEGRKVILNADGTWKYAAALSGVTLKIEAGLIYKSGDVKPVARKTFILLAADTMTELMKLPPATQHNFSGVEQLKGTCETDYPGVDDILRKYTRYTFTTDFDGKAELAIAPGKYWLFGQTLTYERCVTWFLEIELTKDRTIILDQHNTL